MGAELVQFDKDLKRIENLQFALRYADDNRVTLQRQLETVSADQASIYFGVTFDEFVIDLVTGFLLAEVVLLRRAVEHYTSEIHRGKDWRGQSDIKRRCPTFRIKYHRDCTDVHVIDLSNELRNIVIHPLGPEHYKFIERKDLSPTAILQQEATIWTDDDNRRRILILRGNDDKDGYLARWGKIPPGFSHSRADLFSGILFTEFRDCVHAYDSVREMDVGRAIERSSAMHPAIEYL